MYIDDSEVFSVTETERKKFLLGIHCSPSRRDGDISKDNDWMNISELDSDWIDDVDRMCVDKITSTEFVSAG